MNYDSIDCTLVFDISLRDKDNEFMYEDKRHPNCPLIELPPHGRLIDADALKDDGFCDCYGCPYERCHITDAPTIIEAENSFFNSLKRGLEQAINGDVREITIIESEGEDG